MISLHLKKTVFLGRELYCCHLKIARHNKFSALSVTYVKVCTRQQKCDFSCVAKNRKYFPNTSLINFSKNLVYLSQILSDQESPCSRDQRPHKAWEGGSKSSRMYYAHFWTKTVNNCGLCATHASLISPNFDFSSTSCKILVGLESSR